MRDKIILGTVQLGLPYGINNSSGKPPEKEAFSILDFAFEKGIKILDSADAYGEALSVIGEHKKHSGKTFKLINKFKWVDVQSFYERLERSLGLLLTETLHCYMYHDFADYAAGHARPQLVDLKTNGRIEKIGVSLYNDEQLRSVIDDPEVDIIQLPVNILDLDVEKENLLIKAKRNNKEIHARSLYLQGLLLKAPESLTGNLEELKPYLTSLRTNLTDRNMDVKTYALNAILCKPYIDKVVVGIEKQSQLKENLELVQTSFADIALDVVVPQNYRYLLNPVNWKP